MRNLASFTDLILVEEVKSKGQWLTREALDPGIIKFIWAFEHHSILFSFRFEGGLNCYHYERKWREIEENSLP